MGNKASKDSPSYPPEINTSSTEGQKISRVPPPEAEKPWREVPWGENRFIRRDLEGLRPNLEVLRILLIGPAGAGKSCFINSVQRVLLGRNFHGALENSSLTGTSFTRTLRTHKMKKRTGGYYPFEFVDVMGLESEKNHGIQPEDVNKILEGHILDGYTFKESMSISSNDKSYKNNPRLCERVHCVVSILSADSVSRMEGDIYFKFKDIRKKASTLGIPSVIVLTKVDVACQMVKSNIANIYKSTKIKEKVNYCNDYLWTSMNNIYPVENYHAQITQDDNVDLLLLTALRDIVFFANDYAGEL